MRRFRFYYFCDHISEFPSSPESIRSIMSFRFKRRNALPELLRAKRESKRMLDKTIQEIERETQGLQMQDREFVAEAKRRAQLGRFHPIQEIYAEMMRGRNQIQRLYKLVSKLEGVSIKIQALKSAQAIGEAMKCVTKGLKQMNLPFLQKIMHDFEWWNAKMELTSEGDELFSAPSAAKTPESKLSIMSIHSGKRKSPSEFLRTNERLLDKAIQEIERESQGLQMQENELLSERRKSSKLGQIEAVEVISKDINMTRRRIKNLYKLKSQLASVSLKIQTLKSTQAMWEAMKDVTKAIGQMNWKRNLPSLQKIMREFGQNEKMEQNEGEEETEELVSQVLDWICSDISSSDPLLSVFHEEFCFLLKQLVSAPAGKNKLPQSIMSFHSGKRKALSEVLQENMKKLDKAIRDMEREIQSLKTQKDQLIAQRKERSKTRQLVVFIEISLDIGWIVDQIKFFSKLESDLQHVYRKILTLNSTRAIGKAMKGAAKAMERMNMQFNLPSVQKIIQELENVELTSDDALEGDERRGSHEIAIGISSPDPLFSGLV